MPDKNTIEIIAKYIQSDDDTIKIAVMNTQRQGVLPDCGAFAVAFAASLVFGEDPTELEYEDTINTIIRQHLKKCLYANSITPFPSRPNYKSSAILSTTTIDIYCVCRCPDNGKMMIECEACTIWFHAQSECVNISTTSVWQDLRRL